MKGKQSEWLIWKFKGSGAKIEEREKKNHPCKTKSLYATRYT